MADAAELYLGLLKKVLTRALFEDSDEILGVESFGQPSLRRRVAHRVGRLALSRGYEIVRQRPYDAAARERGRDWPARAETMVGLRRLDNLHECVRTVVREQVPGDLVETGIWRGGSSIFMRAALEAYGDEQRRVWAADSFQGLPDAEVERYPADAVGADRRWDTLAVSVEQVRSNFRRYGLLDDRVRFLEGWFEDTLPTAPIDSIAVLRLDGDLYSSTMHALDALYPKLSPGGYCIVDDYGGIPACAQAVHDYRDRHGIREEIVDIDGWAVYWRRDR